MKRSFVPLLVACALAVLATLQVVPSAEAKPDFLTDFVGRYPSSTRLFTCGTCHTNFNGPTEDDLGASLAANAELEILNAYGKAFEEAGGEEQPGAALAAIEDDDSDHDGTTNSDEILTLPGFTPGYNCESYQNTLNAPPNLVSYVDPGDVGCGVVTTTTVDTATTTVVEVTTTTLDASTTTTTLPQQRCAQPVSNGAAPVASDCLYILRAAIGAVTCDPECVCAPKGTLPVTASDALLCLMSAIGANVTLQCPCETPPTTTTLPGSTTTTLPGETTTTLVSVTTTSTTSTTLGGGSIQVGQAVYDNRCASCHSAGSHDPAGFAPDLAGKGNLLVSNLGSISSIMSGITLTNQEITDLGAFLDSL